MSEFQVQNYLGSPHNVTWRFDTGAANLTNSTTVNGSLFVVVQHNYTTAGVYCIPKVFSG